MAHLAFDDSNSVAPAAPLAPLMRDFLTWVARRPRGYAEAMEAWRSSCPRFTIWEDALEDGLVVVERGDWPAMQGSRVILTARGRSLLDGG